MYRFPSASIRYAPSPRSTNGGATPTAGLLASHAITQTDQGLGSSTIAPSTILVISNPEGPAERVLVRSNAAIAMLRELPRPWPAIAAIFRIIPRPLRDIGYRLIARFRYRIWGRLDTCPIPTPQERMRFL
jgi:predicted DCC family thiol-disulfide oxidoreductase YuxK